MKPVLFISDWNGTLVPDNDDKPVLKQIAMDELFYSIKHLKLGRVWQLAQTKKQLEAMVKQYRDDPQSQAELLRATLDLYNTDVIGGMPMTRIDESVGKYGAKAVDRLDAAYYEFCDICDSSCEILTSALDIGVFSVIFRSGKRNIPYVDGSRILKHPVSGRRHRILIADGIELRNYDNKREVLGKKLSSMNINPESVVYMGNDFRDEPCAEIAGRFVVAPLATDEYRQHMTSKYGTKVRTPCRAKGEVYDALTMD